MKHYGIPYMGSKEKILNIIQYIFDREHNKTYFIDPFCGGFSVSAYALENTKFKVLANDLNKYVIALYKEILFNNSQEIKKVWLDWVDREKFADVKANPEKYPEWYVGYVLTIWSFGNSGSTYLFGKDIEPIKKKLHQALVFNEWHEELDWLKEIMPSLPDEYSPDKRLKFMAVYKTATKDKHAELQQLQQLQQLEQLERLESMDWHEFILSIPKEILEKAFIYCDPPYENTGKYAHAMDYKQFWDWFRECPYPVYVSSYAAPEDVKQINGINKKVLLTAANAKRKIARENIYFNGKGEHTPTMYDLLFNSVKI